MISGDPLLPQRQQRLELLERARTAHETLLSGSVCELDDVGQAHGPPAVGHEDRGWLLLLGPLARLLRDELVRELEPLRS